MAGKTVAGKCWTSKLPKSLDIPVTCLVTLSTIVNVVVKEKALTFCGLMSQTKGKDNLCV